jgi:hypothetical protein
MYGRRIQPGYTLLLLLTIAFTVGAIITLGYNAKALTPNLLGYKGISSLAPLTTLRLLACTFITCKLCARYFKK